MRKYSFSGMRGSLVEGSRMVLVALGGAQNRELRDRLTVERVLQNLAGFEGEDAASRNRNLFPGLRIPADAGLLLPHDEVTETRDLDLLAALESLLDAVEDSLDDLGGFLLREPA